METRSGNNNNRFPEEQINNQKGTNVGPLQLKLDFTRKHRFVESDQDYKRSKWFILRSYGDDPE